MTSGSKLKNDYSKMMESIRIYEHIHDIRHAAWGPLCNRCGSIVIHSVYSQACNDRHENLLKILLNVNKDSSRGLFLQDLIVMVCPLGGFDGCGLSDIELE